MNKVEAIPWRLRLFRLRLEVKGGKVNPVTLAQAAELSPGEIEDVEQRQEVISEWLSLLLEGNLPEES